MKVAFRKGQPKDRSGFFRLRHSEELDLDVEYRTDSVSELDLFFRNNAHVRVLPDSQFQVDKAPRSADDPAEIELRSGRMLDHLHRCRRLGAHRHARAASAWAGGFPVAVQADPADSSLLVSCLQGLCGVQETARQPGRAGGRARAGHLAWSGGRACSSRGSGSGARCACSRRLAANVGHYRFSRIEYPKIGYLPKAITGLGFMVFFYGSAIGILDYVNNI